MREMKKSLMLIAAGLLCATTACGSKTGTDSGSMAQQNEPKEMKTDAPTTQQAEEAPATIDTNDFITTPSGLKYKVVREGTGKKPGATDVVTVNYEGRLINGQIFDSSYQRGEPTSFPLNRVIPGWTEGLQLMPEGSEYIFYIPYQLAYGEYGGGPIPPKADLVFRVELLQVQ